MNATLAIFCVLVWLIFGLVQICTCVKRQKCDWILFWLTYATLMLWLFNNMFSKLAS